MKMDYKDKNMLVFGAGISGVGAAALLLDKGAYVTLYDGNAGLDAVGTKKKIEEKCASVENLDIVFRFSLRNIKGYFYEKSHNIRHI